MTTTPTPSQIEPVPHAATAAVRVDGWRERTWSLAADGPRSVRAIRAALATDLAA
jgi:hypothetical protein